MKKAVPVGALVGIVLGVILSFIFSGIFEFEFLYNLQSKQLLGLPLANLYGPTASSGSVFAVGMIIPSFGGLIGASVGYLIKEIYSAKKKDDKTKT